MENHLDTHNFEHRQRMEAAEQHRLAKQLRKEKQRKPNQTMVRLGEMLVEVGEQLQVKAQPKPQHRRT